MEHQGRTYTAAAITALALALAGCGSGGTSVPTPASFTTQPAQPPATSTPSVTSPSPPPSGPPEFVEEATSSKGDSARIEGHFGLPETQSESGVSQETLSECPQPSSNSRELIVRLDLTVTLESSLSAIVDVAPSHAQGSTPTDAVMGYIEGNSCRELSGQAANIEFKSLQPHGSPSHFTMWIALPEVISPADPHPSEKTLGEGGWLMEIPVTIEGSPVFAGAGGKVTLTGTRAITCNKGNFGQEFTAIEIVTSSACPAG